MISVRTKQALQIAKERGVTLGNPQLAAQRNINVSAANSHRVQKQQEWQQKILKVIHHLEATEEVTTCQAIADALNDRWMRTAR